MEHTHIWIYISVYTHLLYDVGFILLKCFCKKKKSKKNKQKNYTILYGNIVYYFDICVYIYSSLLLSISIISHTAPGFLIIYGTETHIYAYLLFAASEFYGKPNLFIDISDSKTSAIWKYPIDIW